MPPAPELLKDTNGVCAAGMVTTGVSSEVSVGARPVSTATNPPVPPVKSGSGELKFHAGPVAVWTLQPAGCVLVPNVSVSPALCWV